jgi:hypothetical protein
MRVPTTLIPMEFSELLRLSKTSGEVAFVCRVLLRKRLASEETIKSVCNLYGLDYVDWRRKGFVDIQEDVKAQKKNGIPF